MSWWLDALVGGVAMIRRWLVGLLVVSGCRPAEQPHILTYEMLNNYHEHCRLSANPSTCEHALVDWLIAQTVNP